MLLQPALLLEAPPSVQRSVHVGVQANDGDEWGIQGPVHVRLGHCLPVGEELGGLLIAEVGHEPSKARLGHGRIVLAGMNVAVVIARDREYVGLVVLVGLVEL